MIFYNIYMNNDDEKLEELNKRLNYNMLYDFYSSLLTERQRKIYELVCFSDMSLGEAAETLGISRQAVHVMKQRIENKLDLIEKNLHLAETTRILEEKIKKLEQEIKCLKH